MSVTLLPGIGELDPGSLCYSIYSQLYHNFFNAQDKKDAQHPYGISEGDETSIRLRNTAYNFAEAISGAVAGDGSGSGTVGILTGYLKKSGGDMTGMLRAGYGFEAGIGNVPVLNLFSENITDTDGSLLYTNYGVDISGDLRIGSGSLIIGGRQFIRYDAREDTATIESTQVDFGHSSLRGSGDMTFGQNRDSGVYISTATIQIKGKEVYHGGNSNLDTADWNMRDGYIAGDLRVSGTVDLSGTLRACNGAELGAGGNIVLSIGKDSADLNGFLSFADGYGIVMGGAPVMTAENNDIRLCASKGSVLLGDADTFKIRLFADLSDINGQNVLLTKYGSAYFPESLTVRHNFGDTLLSSYRVDSADEGIVIHKTLRFGAPDGAALSGDKTGITFSSAVSHTAAGETVSQTVNSILGHRSSTSLFSPQGKHSASIFITTDADFITLDKPAEAKGHIGIDGSLTRLTDGCLFLTDRNFLLAGTDGIYHYGNSYFLGNIGSEKFSSGLAGSGWAVARNLTTGNVVATFDELVVRKKTRFYELEVQKASATNGSLWISDSCSGETVEKIT